MYCYKVIEEMLTWESARMKCKDDAGDLVCFSNRRERDRMSAACDGCWVGYNLEGGKSWYHLDIIYLQMKIVLRYLLLGKWMPITTSFEKICPENVVSGKSGLFYELFGRYGRTSRTSDNKIISYLNTHLSWSVCQKPKQGM